MVKKKLTLLLVSWRVWERRRQTTGRGGEVLKIKDALNSVPTRCKELLRLSLSLCSKMLDFRAPDLFPYFSLPFLLGCINIISVPLLLPAKVRVHDNDFQYVRRHGAMLTVERKA